MSRDVFLQRVRLAAEQGRAHRIHARDLPDDVGYVGFVGDACEKLAREIEAVGGRAFLVDDDAAAVETLRGLCADIAAKSALCWKHPLLDRVGLSQRLAEWNIQALDHDVLRDDPSRRLMLAADIGITSVSYAVAETGSLFMLARPGQERVASLLPPLHVAIVERSQILPDIYDAIGKLRELGFDGLPSNAVFITGPSKTGDMELELTTGVHGPGRWCVIIIR